MLRFTKSFLVFLLILSMSLSFVSCGLFTQNPENSMTDKELFLASFEQIENLFIDGFVEGTDMSGDAVSSFLKSRSYDVSSVMNISSLNIFDTDIVTSGSPVRISLDEEYDSETNNMHAASKFELFGDSLDFELLAKDGKFSIYIPGFKDAAIVPEYLNSDVNVSEAISDAAEIRKIVKDSLSSLLTENRISRERTDFKKKLVSYENITKISLNLSDVDVSKFVYDIVSKILSLPSFESYEIELDEEDFESVIPDDFRINFYFKRGVLLGGDAVFTYNGKSFVSDLTFINFDGTQSLEATDRFGITGSEKKFPPSLLSRKPQTVLREVNLILFLTPKT